MLIAEWAKYLKGGIRLLVDKNMKIFAKNAKKFPRYLH